MMLPYRMFRPKVLFLRKQITQHLYYENVRSKPRLVIRGYRFWL